MAFADTSEGRWRPLNPRHGPLGMIAYLESATQEDRSGTPCWGKGRHRRYHLDRPDRELGSGRLGRDSDLGAQAREFGLDPDRLGLGWRDYGLLAFALALALALASGRVDLEPSGLEGEVP